MKSWDPPPVQRPTCPLNPLPALDTIHPHWSAFVWRYPPEPFRALVLAFRRAVSVCCGLWDVRWAGRWRDVGTSRSTALDRKWTRPRYSPDHHRKLMHFLRQRSRWTKMPKGCLGPRGTWRRVGVDVTRYRLIQHLRRVMSRRTKYALSLCSACGAEGPMTTASRPRTRSSSRSPEPWTKGGIGLSIRRFLNYMNGCNTLRMTTMKIFRGTLKLPWVVPSWTGNERLANGTGPHRQIFSIKEMDDLFTFFDSQSRFTQNSA